MSDTRRKRLACRLGFHCWYSQAEYLRSVSVYVYIGTTWRCNYCPATRSEP